MKRSWTPVPVLIVTIAVWGTSATLRAGAATSPCASAKNVDHQKVLARMEPAVLAANLVAVPGYCYVDLSKAESKQIVAQARRNEHIAAVSAHDIVAEDPTQNSDRPEVSFPEVGFLQLYAFTQAPLAGSEEQLAEMRPDLPPPDALDIAGTKVFRYEDASSQGSRYFYVWARHGTQGVLDGPAREPLEQWLQRYLAEPVLVASEDLALSSALVPVPGYLYANVDVTTSRSEQKGYVTGPLGKVPASVHLVADADGTLGGIVLAEVSPTLTTEQFVARLQKFGLAGFEHADTLELGGTSVEYLTSRADELDAYVWVRDGIAGEFLPAEPDRQLVEPFLAAFLNGGTAPAGTEGTTTTTSAATGLRVRVAVVTTAPAATDATARQLTDALRTKGYDAQLDTERIPAPPHATSGRVYVECKDDLITEMLTLERLVVQLAHTSAAGSPTTTDLTAGYDCAVVLGL